MSRTIIQSYESGAVERVVLPRPALRANGVVAETLASVISPGTERSLTELARKSLLGKALARPDLVRQVLDKARAEGVAQAISVSRERLDTPIPLGYSVAARVLEVGTGCEGLAVGQRVAGTGPGYANHAEINFLPRTLCVPVPNDVSDEQAAFAGLGAIALHAVRTCAPALGETVVVLGVGTLGLFACQMLRASGARVLATDLDRAQLGLARELGASHAFPSDDPLAASAIRDLTRGRGADCVLVFASAPRSSGPLAQAAELVAERGRVVVPGFVRLDVPRKEFYEKEVSLFVPRAGGPGPYDEHFESGEVPYPVSQVRWSATENLRAFLDLLADGSVRVEPLVTQRIGFDEVLDFYEKLASGRGERALGVVVRYAPDASSRSTVRHDFAATERAATPQRDSIAGRRARVGVIGSGLFTRSTLLPALAKVGIGAPAGIASRGGLHAFTLGRKYDFRYAASDARVLLDDPEIDAVLITTRHDQHAKLACEALSAGKHVLVEKPLAMSAGELQEVIAVAESHPDRVLMVGFNRRFAPSVAFVRERLAALPDPPAIQIRSNAGWLPRTSWVYGKSGGGRIHSEVCHYLDLVSGLTGSLPVRVHAESLRVSSTLESDNVAITVALENGAIASILYTGAGDRGYSRERVELHGGGASAEIVDFRRARVVVGGRAQSRRWLRPDYGHRGELEAFLDAVVGSEASPVALADYAATTWATLAIERSLATGRAVEIAEIAEDARGDRD